MTKTVLTRISKIAIAIVFLFVICFVAIGSAVADDHRGGDNRNAGHDRDRGRQYVPAHRDYYYAPPPNYYTAPEPAYYYPPEGGYVEAPPSPGISLFFGL
ncbi:MAG: hypothetical protein ACLQDV_06520 [Candidatus Binataceae bacterium]